MDRKRRPSNDRKNPDPELVKKEIHYYFDLIRRRVVVSMPNDLEAVGSFILYLFMNLPASANDSYPAQETYMIYD